MKAFICPTDARVKMPWNQPFYGSTITMAYTCFLGNSGGVHGANDGVLFSGSKVTMSQIQDGASQTIYAGERPPSKDMLYGWWHAAAGGDGKGAFDFVIAANSMNVIAGKYLWYSGCGVGPFEFSPSRVDDIW